MGFGLIGMIMDRKKKEGEHYITGISPNYSIFKRGDWTYWYKNGQKSYKTTYKDGDLISEECWDEDGNECECYENWREGCI